MIHKPINEFERVRKNASAIVAFSRALSRTTEYGTQSTRSAIFFNRVLRGGQGNSCKNIEFYGVERLDIRMNHGISLQKIFGLTDAATDA